MLSAGSEWCLSTHTEVGSGSHGGGALSHCKQDFIQFSKKVDSFQISLRNNVTGVRKEAVNHFFMPMFINILQLPVCEPEDRSAPVAALTAGAYVCP